MLRLLKMLVLPLVSVSMVAGICALRESSAHSVGRLARLTFCFHAGGWVGSGWGGAGWEARQDDCRCCCCSPREPLRFTPHHQPTPPHPTGSTLLAIALGILLVVVVRPGRGAPFDAMAAKGGGGAACRAEEAARVDRASSAPGGAGAVGLCCSQLGVGGRHATTNNTNTKNNTCAHDTDTPAHPSTHPPRQPAPLAPPLPTLC